MARLQRQTAAQSATMLRPRVPSECRGLCLIPKSLAWMMEKGVECFITNQVFFNNVLPGRIQITAVVAVQTLIYIVVSIIPTLIRVA